MAFYRMIREMNKILIDDLPWNQPFDKPFKKNASMADRYRKTGEKSFAESDFKMALEDYNIGLCYAPTGSKNIPLLYGNRSAVYYEMGKYALALENIKLARDSGFPIVKMAELDDREEKCKELMEEFGPDKDSATSSFFKLSHPANKKIPFIADCLELRKNEKYGRHIITTKGLKTGDILAIEPPVVSFLTASRKDPHCFFCAANKSGSLIPCSHCTAVMFCSEMCKKKAALIHPNDNFNGVIGFSRQDMVLKMVFEAFRIAGGFSELLELLEDSEGKTIFDFDFSNPAKEKDMLIILNGLSKNFERKDYNKYGIDKVFNTSPINEKPTTAEEREELMTYISNQFLICASNLERTRSCAAIYLFESLLNHSCYPNAVCIKFDIRSVLIVARPIKAGEQIFSSYIRGSSNQTREERHDELKEFQFTCDCVVCTNNWPLELPKKDESFVRPEIKISMPPADIVKQFKKNCEYIDNNAEKMPCYEVQRLMLDNQSLVSMLGGATLDGDEPVYGESDDYFSDSDDYIYFSD